MTITVYFLHYKLKVTHAVITHYKSYFKQLHVLTLLYSCNDMAMIIDVFSYVV